ncbi:MAG: LON peptidase substrate-binding domain-containing protein [Hyphomicrobiaceae bacterium]
MKSFTRYRSTDDLPTDLPIFPLQGAILLPRATLPLNIFEPRYLTMVDYAITGHRLIGMVQPKSSDDSDEESPIDTRAPLKDVGSVGRITAFQEQDDGRMVISLTGVSRFRTVEEHVTDQLFRLFSVTYEEFANDLQSGVGENEVDREKLLEVLRGYLSARNLQADWQAIDNAPTELLVNSLSTISPFGPEEKQALLEAKDLKSRAEALATLALMEMAADDRSGGSVQ